MAGCGLLVTLLAVCLHQSSFLHQETLCMGFRKAKLEKS
jgi:hypothetical protein